MSELFSSDPEDITSEQASEMRAVVARLSDAVLEATGIQTMNGLINQKIGYNFEGNINSKSVLQKLRATPKVKKS